MTRTRRVNVLPDRASGLAPAQGAIL
jgi:hypothetical protein